MKQIEESQRVLNETIANHRSETESLQRAMQKQEELYAEQQRRFEEESRQHQSQVQDLRRQAEEAQRNYEKLSRDHEATQERIRAAEAANQQLQSAYQELRNREPPAPPRQKKKSFLQKVVEIAVPLLPVVNMIPGVFSMGNEIKDHEASS
ncbi:unnamed protein product [Adineta steineri]|uniref:Uncharacterized protein n=2 Tax=Adineta steineri TaxID=433720 RepID=A0A814BPB5_9BILA|nr:unnamed protein product [Adineta steineri]CAF0817498.1 unnamed protein product [Adineta steineri]CAF0931004.1 unnamed protein product [Adineta steineri]